MTTPDASANQSAPEDQGERLRRDEPARTAPNRQSASMFLSSSSEAVEAGVNTAYKVYGDYLRRGQEAAQNQNGGADRPQNPWATPGVPWASMTTIPLQMFRAWAQLASTWAELSMLPGASEGVRQMTRLVEDFWAMAGVASPTSTTNEAQDLGKPSAAQTSVRCSVEIASAQPVEVDIEFDPPPGVVPMIQRLHPLRGDAPPLAGLEFEYDPSTGRAKLSLAVPPSQDQGAYVGTIFDDRDDRACGTIKVRVKA